MADVGEDLRQTGEPVRGREHTAGALLNLVGHLASGGGSREHADGREGRIRLRSVSDHWRETADRRDDLALDPLERGREIGEGPVESRSASGTASLATASAATASRARSVIT